MDLLSTFIVVLFDTFYIVCWITFVYYLIYIKWGEPLVKHIEYLTNKVNELHNRQIDIDIFVEHFCTSPRNSRRNNRRKYKRGLNNIPTVVSDSEICTSADSISISHITFPHYCIYDKINTNTNTKFDNYVLLSHQMSEFMGYTYGKTMLRSDINKIMKKYFNHNNIFGMLVLDTKSRKWLNIPEDKCPKITASHFMLLVNAHLK